ncbi:SDR family oxidoreductase [Actinoplanes sp. NPDC051494]|uniref:SDR family oxidoreductase n=1 Tax=Actinoplanes sp. NPDC051494 TaxID=3363907 RepID=UPI003794A9C3
MTNTAKKVVVVTGASSGIGEAVARRMAADGHIVVAGARREERLETIATEVRAAGGTIDVGPLDVTDRAAMIAFVTAAAERHGRVDVLVSNAGVMLLSMIGELLVDEWDRMIDVNLRGLLNGIAAVLPVFRAQGSGHLVSVASIGAHSVVPTSGVYSATKYAAWAVAEGLRQESDPGLRVTTVSPGVTESELAEHISDPVAREAMLEYRRNVVPASAIAAAVAYAVDQPAGVDVNEIIVRPAAQRP